MAKKSKRIPKVARQKSGPVPHEGPTPGENEVLQCFGKLLIKHGESPSLHEIARRLGLSQPVVQVRMQRLAEKGLTRRPTPWTLTKAGMEHLGINPKG